MTNDNDLILPSERERGGERERVQRERERVERARERERERESERERGYLVHCQAGCKDKRPEAFTNQYITATHET